MSKSNSIYKIKYNKAQSHLKANRLTEAHEILSALCNRYPTKIQLWLDLALTQRKLQQYDQAEETCRQLLSTHPDNPSALHVMGSICHCLNRFDDAINYYKKSLSLDTHNPEGFYFLGNSYQILKNYEAAADSYKKAVELKPDYLQALSNLGASLIHMRQMTEAKTVLQKAYAINRHSEHVLCNLAEYSLQLNLLAEGIDYAKQAVFINNNFRDAYLILGKLYRQDGDFENALKNLKIALRLDKDNLEIIAAIAEIYERQGDVDQSLKLLEPLIKTGNTDQQVIIKYARLAKNIDKLEDATELLEQQLATTDSDTLSLLAVHNELGKLYELLKDYDKSYSHFRQANDIEIKINKEFRENRNLTISKEQLDDCDKQYDRDYWASIATSEIETKTPIFIVGMPRSGTTLVEQILSSHPEVYGAGELINISNIASKLSLEHNIILPTEIKSETLNAQSQSYLSAINALSVSSKFVTDKMPTNFYYLGLISKLFPHSKIIHVERNALDTCTSILFERFGPQMTYTTDATELAEYYLIYKNLMQYWSEVLDFNIHTVKYEDLVHDQEANSKLLLEYCGIPWNDACFNFHENTRDVNTPSYDQVRKPMYNSSVGRWKNYEKHLGQLIEKLGQRISE